MIRPLRTGKISRRHVAGLCGAMCTLLVACGRSNRDLRINNWMSCIECIDSQRVQVEELGNRAVPTLAVILRSPPPSRLENARRHIIESYQPVTALTQQDYVDAMLGAYIAMNQIRAALSLGDIGTPEARTELERALAQAESRGYRRDVVQTISGALARTSHSEFTGGRLTPTAVDFGDTVRVHAGDVAWDGNESVEVHGSPFGTELFLNRFDAPGNDDSLEFVAVGEVGAYVVSVTKLGANDITQLDTTLRIRSLKYAAHTPATADIISEAVLPRTRYLVLGSAGGLDTIDYLRVQPNSDVSLTAAARWPGLDNVHLAWRSCGGGRGGGSPGSFPGGSTVSGRVVDQNGNELGDAVVQVPGTADSAATGPNGTFSIVGLPPSATTGGLVSIQIQRTGFHPRLFTVPAGSVGHVFGLGSPGATPATATAMTSSTMVFNTGDCGYLQVWSPPGRHHIVQLRVTSAPATSGVVSPRAVLLSPGQLAQLTAAVPVTWASSNSSVATVDATGAVTGVTSGSAMIRVTLVADPSKTDSALVRVYPPAGAAWVMTAPAAADTVNRDGSGQPTVTVAAQAIGPTGSFPNPFAIVEFWARTTGAGVWRRIGQVSSASAILTDNGVNRFWTYSTTWNPDPTTAPFTTPSLTRLDLIAIGVSPAGAVSSTPLNALLWVRIP